MILKFIEFLRARMKMVVWCCYAVLALLVAHYAFFVDKSSAHIPQEHYFFFWAGFGYIACLLIIFVSKWYGHLGIMTREDYYDE